MLSGASFGFNNILHQAARFARSHSPIMRAPCSRSAGPVCAERKLLPCPNTPNGTVRLLDGWNKPGKKDASY